MKTQGVSQFVTHVNLDQHSNTCARDHAHAGICSVHQWCLDLLDLGQRVRPKFGQANLTADMSAVNGVNSHMYARLRH